LGYAASADWELVGGLRGGIEAFGELGSTGRLFPRADHFVGPILKTEVEHLPGHGELGINMIRADRAMHFGMFGTA